MQVPDHCLPFTSNLANVDNDAITKFGLVLKIPNSMSCVFISLKCKLISLT